MEIERINENTVKFFLSYNDIEERGFTREEVWYNRAKSEELFWEMMDELNEESEFEVEGPLWIQVHAMNNGIEVTVTRSQSSEDGKGSSPFDGDTNNSFQREGEGFNEAEEITGEGQNLPLEWLENTFYFKDFEDIILLSNRVTEWDIETSLYSLENIYYLHVKYDIDKMDDMQKTDFFSVLSEFGYPSNVTIHRLQEYGKVVLESDVFNQIKKYFGTP